MILWVARQEGSGATRSVPQQWNATLHDQLRGLPWLAMACHINLAETGRSVVLAAVSGKTRRATCASPTTRQRSPSWKGTMSACRQWHTKCDGRHASESEASTQSNTHTHSQKKNINQKWKNMRISEKPLPGSWWWTKDRHLPESFACRQWGLDGPKQEKIPTLRLLLRIQHQNLRNPPTTLSEGWPQHSTLDNLRNIMHKQVALALLQYVTIHCKNKINRWIHVGSFKKLLSIEPPSRNVRPLVVPRVDQAHPNR